MTVCYCRNSGGYGRFLQVVEQEPVPRNEDEGSGNEPAGRMTKRKRRQSACAFEAVKAGDARSVR